MKRLLAKYRLFVKVFVKTQEWKKPSCFWYSVKKLKAIIFKLKIETLLPENSFIFSYKPWRFFNSELRSFHSLLLDWRSIDLSGARQKEGHFHYKIFLRASKWGIACHTCSIIPKSLYWGLGLSLIHSKGILGWWSRYGMWYLISKLSKSFYNESDLLFLVHHWGRLTSDLRVMAVL